MLRFLLFSKCLIFIAAQSFDFCYPGSKFDLPQSLEHAYIGRDPSEYKKCGKGFNLESDNACYKFTPSNSESFDLFEKKCSCEHGTPRKYKHNGINNRMNNRHKRHLRGFPHQNIRYAAPFQPRPQFVVAPRANNNYANQAARVPQSIPLVDHNTYECIKQPDNCYKYPKPNIPEDNCPPGWIFIRSFGSNCYKFHPAQTWHEAERTCISQNAHLASARVGKEMDVLSDFSRQIFPNNVHRFQTHPLIIEEYHTWIGLNLTDRSNITWTDGNQPTWWIWTDYAKLDNVGGNENCGFIVYKLDCTMTNAPIKVNIQDTRCDAQMPFACKLNKAPPAAASTTSPPITPTPTTKTTTEMQIETTKKARKTCMV